MTRSKTLSAVTLGVSLAVRAAASPAGDPALPPAPPTAESPHVGAGVLLHDQGDYDGAIREYQKALDENPADVVALYEMAFSYLAKKDCPQAIAVAEKGLKVGHGYAASLYLVIGGCRDDLGDPKGAIAAYEAGIAAEPTTALLHFNLGVTYSKLRDWRQARLAYEKALFLDPAHASSHLGLAEVYEKDGYKVPALLALLRFLSLEPASERSRGALASVDRVFHAGVTPGEKPGDLTVTIDSKAKTDEGDFGPLETGMLLAQAAQNAEQFEKTKSEPELTVGRLESQIGMLAEGGDLKTPGFAARHYLPFFRQLQQKGLARTFSYYVYQSSEVPGVSRWLAEHSKQVDDLKRWLAAPAAPAGMIRY
ncbi:MAG TPA: tetratricopeptide repeat protein [Thermoanaerobaculia bacterium]|nr:tetratricopeptide repeat protein [Thermoanaerobaculia bacterium]